jgi:hypothetical protein
MATRVLFPNAIDFVRVINDNVIDNALGRRSSFLLLPSLYQRAFLLTKETGELPLTENFIAPDESTTTSRRGRINIITSEE